LSGKSRRVSLDRMASLENTQRRFVELRTQHCNFISEQKVKQFNPKERRTLGDDYPDLEGSIS